MSASKQAPSPLKVFISYSREDLADADVLADTLERNGIDALVDRRDLPYGEAWQGELADMIRASDTVVWLVSPHSLRSKWCQWELGEVSRLHKRLVPVLIAPVARHELPEMLGAIQLLPNEGTFSLDRHFGALQYTLQTDFSWIKEQTRLADLAQQWMSRNKAGAFLLKGARLSGAEEWLQQRKPTAPEPTAAILELILASRNAATRLRRWMMAGPLLAAAVLALGYVTVQYARITAMPDTNLAMGDIENFETGDNGYQGNRSKMISPRHRGCP